MSVEWGVLKVVNGHGPRPFLVAKEDVLDRIWAGLSQNLLGDQEFGLGEREECFGELRCMGEWLSGAWTNGAWDGMAYETCTGGIFVCEPCMVCNGCPMTKISAIRGLLFVVFMHGLLWWFLKGRQYKARFKRNEEGTMVRGSARLLQDSF